MWAPQLSRDQYGPESGKASGVCHSAQEVKASGLAHALNALNEEVEMLDSAVEQLAGYLTPVRKPVTYPTIPETENLPSFSPAVERINTIAKRVANARAYLSTVAGSLDL